MTNCPHCEKLQEKIEVLEQVLGLHEEFPIALRLRPSGRALLGLLMKREYVSDEAAIFCLYQGRNTTRGTEPELNTISVQIHHLRGKLKPYGIGISRRWSAGYFMTADDKAKCRALVASLREPQAA